MELLTALKISLVCMAVFACGWKDMIFYSFYNKVECKLKQIKIGVNVCKIIVKPLFRCPICMSSFWTLVFWIVWAFSFNPVLMILYVCGINTVLTAIIAPIIPDDED